jgi:hypothetical protein
VNTPDSRQLNLRLSARDRDRLEAHAYVRRTPAGALTREIVAEWLSAHESDPGIATVSAGLVESDAARKPKPSKVTELRPRKSLE